MRRASGGLRACAAVVVALAVLLPAGAAPADARSSTSAARGLRDKISQAADDLASANKAVARAATQLAAAQSALPAAQSRLATAERAEATARAAAAAAAADQADAANRAALATRKVAAAQAQIAETHLQIGALVRAVYTQGPYAELAAVLSATTPSEFAESLEAVRSVSRSQNKVLADLQVAKADLAFAQAQAQAAQLRADAASAAAAASLASAARAKADAATAKARVASLVASRSQALAVAARERASVKRQYQALKAEQVRLSRLERSRSGFRGRATGTLDWPIPGASIVGGVGWRVHPVYGYRSCHTGVDIRGSYGTAILAPADGLVIDILNGGAYGLHTLISHGGGLVTMYAHQSRSAVHVGQTVRRGQVIGYVGSSGWVTGPHLHWEVHVNGVPFDPMGWFGGARVPVPCWSG